MAQAAGTWDPSSEFCLREEFLSMLQQEKLSEEMCCINNWKSGQEYLLQKPVRPGDSLAQSNSAEKKVSIPGLYPWDVASSKPFTLLMFRARKLTQPRKIQIQNWFQTVLCTLAGWPHRVTTEEYCTHVGMHSGVQSLLSQQVVLCQWFNLF